MPTTEEMYNESLNFIKECKNYDHMQFANTIENIDDLPRGELFHWIQNKSNWASLKIHAYFPLADIQKEVIDCHRFWVKHRGFESDGWESMCVHGQSLEHTGGYTESLGDYHWTELAEHCPKTVKWLKEYWGFSSYDRVRFMKLKPGGFIRPHQDSPNRKLTAFNLSIIEPSYGHEFAMEEAGLIPWQEGDIRLIDIGRKHSLVNNGTEDRIHMIIHGRYGPNTLNFINDSFKIEHEKLLLDRAQ